MCGIAGIINSKLSRDELKKHLTSMQRALHHRGPDDQGLFISSDAAAGLISTRLAILDLSAAGHQPMQSPDGRYTIVFNGEAYNHGALRAELSVNGYQLRSHSDTEVILELFAREGAKCLDRLEGMFAFAIWDEQEKTCFLARDPLGIKPLYYFVGDESLSFASELQALMKSGLVPHDVSPAGAHGYLMYGSVQEPGTLVENVRMLPAGHHLIWRDGKVTIEKYWDFNFGIRNSEFEMERSEAVKIVRDALEESMERHLVSDVPVGIFLSGGIDSTAIVALASQKVKEPLRTFSISFDDPTFDEGDVAAKTAAHFGTQHTDWRLDADIAKGLLSDFLKRSDQPSIDGFNTFCVAKMAHDHGLKVVLSGLGGDEVFGGYRSFELIPGMIKASRRISSLSPMRSIAGHLMELFGTTPRSKRLGCFLQKSPSLSSAYWCMRGIFSSREVNRLLPQFGIDGDNGAWRFKESDHAQPTMEDDVSYLELTRYMRNQLLRDSDVMSMAWSLELRVPFADRKLIETVGKIPAWWRLASGKQMLLDAIPEIPEWVRNRPKQGFTFPFKDWVTSEWSDTFQRIEAESPVRLKSWYRAWCLFALENFMTRSGIAPRVISSRLSGYRSRPSA